MKKTVLGELEELVLLVVASTAGEAYGVSVMEQLREETGRQFNVSAVHTTLYRLEEKGFLASSVGGATLERGGRSKRLFTLTAEGARILHEIQTMRTRLWQAIPVEKLKLLGIQ